MAREIVDIYRDLALWAAENSPKKWKMLHINMEVLRVNDEIANSWIMKWSKGLFSKSFQIEIPGLAKLEMRDLFLELNEAAMEEGNTWTVCDFRVFANGRYEVSYSYDAPPRLSGNLSSGA